MRLEGPAKFDIDIKSDCLIICFTFATKLPGSLWAYIQRGLLTEVKLHLPLREPILGVSYFGKGGFTSAFYGMLFLRIVSMVNLKTSSKALPRNFLSLLLLYGDVTLSDVARILMCLPQV